MIPVMLVTLLGAILYVFGLYLRYQRESVMLRNKQARQALPPWQERCAVIGEQEPLATCQHLAPLESALRTSGIRLRHTAGGSPNVVLCECWFHEEALRREFPLPQGVRYQAYGDHFGDGQQSLECSVCGSAITVLEPSQKTPRFPPELPGIS